MTLRIYFAGSIRGGRKDRETYAELIKHISKHGKVLTEHIGDASITQAGEDGSSDNYIYNRDMNWLEEADVLIAEVSTPSLGVGYEIAKAETLGKKILCLYNSTKNLSAMLNGNPHLRIESYKTLDEAFSHIDNFLSRYHSRKINQKLY